MQRDQMNNTHTEYLLQVVNPNADRSINVGKYDANSPFRHHLSKATVNTQNDRPQNAEPKSASTSTHNPETHPSELTHDDPKPTVDDASPSYQPLEHEAAEDGYEDQQTSLTSLGEVIAVPQVSARVEDSVHTPVLTDVELLQNVTDDAEVTLALKAEFVVPEAAVSESSNSIDPSMPRPVQARPSRSTAVSPTSDSSLPTISPLPKSSVSEGRIVTERKSEAAAELSQAVAEEVKQEDHLFSMSSAARATHSQQERDGLNTFADESSASQKTVDPRRRSDERVKMLTTGRGENATSGPTNDMDTGNILVATKPIADYPVVAGGSEQIAEHVDRLDAKVDALVGLLGRSQELTTGPRHSRGAVGTDELPFVDANRFVGRVAKAFHTAQERGGVLQIRLSPPELGSLRIELTIQDGVMSAALETETVLTKRVLLEHLPVLRERLAEQNVRIERFDVDVRDENYRGQPDGHGRYHQQERHANQSATRSHIGHPPLIETPDLQLHNLSTPISNLSINLVV